MNHVNIAHQVLEDTPVLFNKIQKSVTLPDEDIGPLLVEVLRFMQLTATTGERLTPSHIVDLAWHEFILFTKYYAAFCDTHFGHFIHHHPGGKEEENRLCFKKTHYHYQKSFSTAPEARFWGRVLSQIADEADCGV